MRPSLTSEKSSNSNTPRSRNIQANYSEAYRHSSAKSPSPGPYGTNFRQGSVEPSLSLSQARLGSVGRDIEGFEYPSRSWRSKIRSEQLADNRRLLDSIRKSCAPETQNMNEISNRNRKYHQYKNIPDDKNISSWMPVHEWAIQHHRFGQNRNFDMDRNNNLINSYQKRREISEPPGANFASKIKREREDNNNLTRKIQIDPPENLENASKNRCSKVGENIEFLENLKAPVLTMKERKKMAENLTSYLNFKPADLRETPGFSTPMTNHERIREGVDCDLVFDNVVLGNGATLKHKTYLKRIGITHILNAAEYRGVNIGQDFFNQIGDKFKYLGIRIEDTPQTQICRYFDTNFSHSLCRFFKSAFHEIQESTG